MAGNGYIRSWLHILRPIEILAALVALMDTWKIALQVIVGVYLMRAGVPLPLPHRHKNNHHISPPAHTCGGFFVSIALRNAARRQGADVVDIGSRRFTISGGRSPQTPCVASLRICLLPTGTLLAGRVLLVAHASTLRSLRPCPGKMLLKGPYLSR